MNIFGMGPMELILILVIALIIFGPGKLPEIAAGIGRAIREFRRMSADVTREFNQIAAELQGAEPQGESSNQGQEAVSESSSDSQPTVSTSTAEAGSDWEAKAQAEEEVATSAEEALLDESPQTIVFEPPEEACVIIGPEGERTALADQVDSDHPTGEEHEPLEYEDEESEARILER